MSTEDAVSEPKEPEGTDVPTEITENETAGGDTAESADIGTSADTKTVDTDTAVSAEGSSKTDTEKSPTGEAEKSGDSDAAVVARKTPAADTEAGKASEQDKTVESATGEGGDAEDVEQDKTVVLDKSSTDEAESGEDTGSDKTVQIDKASASSTAAAEKGDRSDARAKSSANEKSVLSRGRLLTVVAAVLLIAAMVAVGVFAFQAKDRREELDRRAAATKAACDFGHNFATYTGDRVDDYLSRLDQSATGEWKKLVSQIGPDLKARFAERQVSSSAGDVQCGYESGSDDKARVVLIIDQSFTTAGSATPGQVKVAANVDMEKVGDRWMVANFDTPMVQQ
ncbi:hypothetical protein [Nocardia paucivorans]|uniref:hypothetical protein n=1 Tax=Nocardia paucivorans TaxID=114259 RepID=UPI0005942971|nr:hypothetical protein [Nocardia paucivorans]